MMTGAKAAPADDLYGLGIIVYELLTGKHPFGEKNAREAREAGLRPAPIRSLRRAEWRTLARALAFDRTARPRDADEFIRGFFPTTYVRNALIAAIALLVMGASYLSYRNYQQEGPEVPLEQLPPADQSKVKADLADGGRLLEFYRQGISDALQGALDDFADAYALHKGDREAVKGLETVARETLASKPADAVALRERAKILADRSEYLRNYPPVLDALNR